MTETYEKYCSGIKNAFLLLAELRDYEEFDHFLREPPTEGRQPSITRFIQKPLEHIKNLVLNLQKIQTLTPLGHRDRESLGRAIEGMVNMYSITVEIVDPCRSIMWVPSSVFHINKTCTYSIINHTHVVNGI